jgi:molybdopterin-binding protein
MVHRSRLRIGQAAELLNVSVDTLRAWGDEGRLAMQRTKGGQRTVAAADVMRLLAEQRRAPERTPEKIAGHSARNRFEGIVTRIDRDRVAAVVEVMAGPHRVVSMMTAEAVDELGLNVGDAAICLVKATNVMLEVPGR